MKKGRDAGFSSKRSGNAGSGLPFQTLVNTNYYCRNEDIKVAKGQCPLLQRYFCTGFYYGGKQLLARVIEIQKENVQKTL